ncbi:MAG TPA: phosphoribosylformylglycinamidine synthase subunit PurS, partial [Tepidisphaeraceae bacterium]|nr:phosphoribosylformylglycinamidine synthase subunit PurS [Tepidisphaeraceae bacterium]
MIYRIDVQNAPTARGGQAAVDPVGQAIRHQIQEFGTTVGNITTARIFLIDAQAERAQIERAARELLADPLVESAYFMDTVPVDTGKSRIEIHLKAGVMDPVASSTEMALRDMGVAVREVRTGRAYLIDGVVSREELQTIASRVLANGVIESVHFDAYIPTKFETGREYQFQLRHVSLRALDDGGLQKLSREGHLFLSLAEMKAIQNYFRGQNREPTDIELETLAQTWSEHCVHKTLKSAVDVEVRDASGKVVGTRRYKNLIKETIFDSTMELMRKDVTGFCLSVFKDNAGVIAFDDTDAVCFKVETHNHPSAIEPYGGSATGVGGVIRDILGTGLAAKPIANTDVFCVADPKFGQKNSMLRTSLTVSRSAASKMAIPYTPTDPRVRDFLAKEYPTGAASFALYEHPTYRVLSVSAFDKDGNCLKPATDANTQNLRDLGYSTEEMKQAGVPVTTRDQIFGALPRGIIHPKRILQQVVAGVRDYGNRMGIPTVNGAVYFDDRYLGNPLVFCGCVGLIPRNAISKAAQPGDAIVVVGGRTGRDGIHGATFSSAELTDTHADEFSHAVQIGNAITEKKVADVILQARDRNLFTAITDCGAGGLSSAIGEMAAE